MSPALNNPSCRVAFPRQQLLRWYRQNARDLPWRHTRDPYAIWVSEVMLQQTQVATVIPYYERFLAAFPTIEKLAAAPVTEVLRLWEGLGYYRRARHLHLAARQLVAEHNGDLPNDPAVLEALPGLGRYTVAAVLSQAFDHPLAILEANSRRLLARFYGIAEDPTLGCANKELWRLAEALVPPRGAGEFNQALMELGALVCVPKAPRCAICPLKKGCRARKRGLQASLPRHGARPRAECIEEVGIVAMSRGKVLLLQRPGHGRWAGLWEFPHGPLKRGESTQTTAARLLRELTGLQADIRDPLRTIRFSVTRFRYRMTCYLAVCACRISKLMRHRNGRWLSPCDLSQYPMSSPQRRLANMVQSAARGQ